MEGWLGSTPWGRDFRVIRLVGEDNIWAQGESGLVDRGSPGRPGGPLGSLAVLSRLAF